MVDEYGAIGGLRIGRGNRSTRRRTAPVSLCPPQIPHNPIHKILLDHFANQANPVHSQTVIHLRYILILSSDIFIGI
jgi:hypothetical protein